MNLKSQMNWNTMTCPLILDYRIKFAYIDGFIQEQEWNKRENKAFGGVITAMTEEDWSQTALPLKRSSYSVC